MKKYLCTLSLLSILFLAGCSSDDDEANQNPDPDPNPVASSLMITGSAEEIEVGQDITFTVIDDLDEDRTNEATINVNDAPIETNLFTSNETGNYTATASLEDLTSNSFNFTVTEPTDFRTHNFDQTLVVYQGYLNEDDEEISIDGYVYIILAYDGQSILENQNAPEQSEDLLGFIIVTQEDENGIPYLPGESIETEELVNSFLLKENGGEETDYTNYFEQGNYNINYEEVLITSEMGGSASYELALVFNETESYTGTFDGDFLFIDLSDMGGGDPEERLIMNETELNQYTLDKLKACFKK